MEMTLHKALQRYSAALTTLVLLLAFGLGFILSEMSIDQMDGTHFYVYDTKQKVDGYWRGRAKAFFDRTGVTPESPEAKEYMARGRNGWLPLVEVGPFLIFLFDEGDRRWYTVVERSSHVLLAQLACEEQAKELRLFSSLEKGWKFPRFMSTFRYTENGTYTDGVFSVFREDATRERTYFDTQGIGILDTMYVFENGEQFTYYLNGLTWDSLCPCPDTVRLPKNTGRNAGE